MQKLLTWMCGVVLLALSGPATAQAQSAADYRDQAQAKSERGDLDGAIADFTKAIELDPDHARTYARRGDARKGKGDLDGAIADYTQAIEKDPSLFWGYYDRARARMERGDLDDAIADFTRALDLDPTYAWAHVSRGDALSGKGDLDGAIADYTQAIETDPNLFWGYQSRADARQEKGDLDGAIADYTHAITIDAQSVHAYFGRGKARESSKDDDGALADFDRAIELDPEYFSAFKNRAYLRRRKGDLDLAIADYSRAITLKPGDAATYRARGHLLYRRQSWEGALRDFRKACEDPSIENDDALIHIQIYLTRARLGERQQASAELERYFDSHSGPEDDARKNSAVFSFLCGRLSEADFLKLIDSPDASTRRWNVCAMYFFAGSVRLIDGDRETAADYFQRCIETGLTQDTVCDGAVDELRALGRSIPDARPGARPDAAAGSAPSPSGSPKFDTPTPGAVLASAPVGPAGGSVAAPGKITIDLPPGALAEDQAITLRQGSGGLDGGTTYFVEGNDGAHLDLKAPATVRIPVPAGTDPSDLVVFQQMDEGAAIGFKPRFDPATGSLVFSVNHFSWLSWGKVQKWAVWTGGWTVVILVASGGGWTLGAFAMLCSAGASLGTIEAPKLEHLRQTYGLDAKVSSPHFSVLYAREGKYALTCPNPWILVREGDQWSHTSAKSVAEARRQHPDAQDIVPVDPDVANLGRELETVYEYYKQAGYAPPDHTWVSVWPGVGITLLSDTEVAGEWDSGPPGHPGFLRINAKTILANERMERHQTISHEYLHAICDHNEWEGIAPCTEESLTTTMESEIFPSCDGPGTNRPWRESIKFLENGLMASGGPKESDADSVKRGYWLWPFGKFLLHRMGGHEDLRQYMAGTMQENQLSATFRSFARALFDGEGAPGADGEASPLVSAGAPFQVPTGWGGYAPDSGDICGETLALGMARSPSTLATLRPLSFTMRRLDVKLSRALEAEEAPVLVVRRKTPWTSEEFLFKRNGGEVVAAKETLVVGGGDLLAGGGDALQGRLGIVDPTPGPSYDNPMVAYLLASPSLEPVPPSPERPQVYPLYRIEPFQAGGAGDGINPEGAAAGYRVLLREKPEEGEAEGELVECDDLLPLDTKTFDVRDVAPMRPPHTVAVAGICVEDKEVTDESGKPLRSGPFMLPVTEAASLGIRGGVGAGKGVIGAEYDFAAEGVGIPSDVEYTWDFGDQTGASRGEKATHKYKAAGTYMIRLRAKWGSGELDAAKQMEIAADVELAKADVNIHVFRWRKNRMGKSKQACQILHVAILNKEGQVIDGGHADGKNGLFTMTLPVGHYGYKVDYKYTNPDDGGSTSGAFDVREDDPNWVEVETPSSEDFGK